jgi:hypothetical protein
MTDRSDDFCREAEQCLAAAISTNDQAARAELVRLADNFFELSRRPPAIGLSVILNGCKAREEAAGDDDVVSSTRLPAGAISQISKSPKQAKE